MSESKGVNPVVAAELAHEIRNVFTIIRTSTLMLREVVGDDADAASVLDDLLAAAERASGLSHHLMELARRAGAPGEATSLGTAVEQLAGTLRRLAPGNVHVVVSADPGVATTVPARDVQLVLVNLAYNAFDAMPEGGVLTVLVTASEDGQRAVWTVTDTGVGMDAATLDRCFAAFFTTKATGNGLGLHSVREVVERHAGKIALASAPGRGTTITIQLPRAR